MRSLWLLVCLVILLMSCAPQVAAPIDVTLEYMHLDKVVSRQVQLYRWQVSEVTAPSPVFEVFSLRVGGREYVCDDSLTVYNPSTKKVLVMSQPMQDLLFSMLAELRSLACAKPLPWVEAQRIISRMESATIYDIETGLSFDVQRRGGTYHADVQPLTRADTAIMKSIYGGVWSWDRRAVIVDVDGETIAASMNGMPHGQGALTNNFPGHFCLHFWGSVTHGSRSKDLGHHLMISKAAGDIWGLARAATPEEQVKNMAAALNQKDWWLTGIFLLPIPTAELEHLAANVETIEIDKAVLVGPANEICEVSISGEVIYRGGSRAKMAATVQLKLVQGVWKINPLSLNKLF